LEGISFDIAHARLHEPWSMIPEKATIDPGPAFSRGATHAVGKEHSFFDHEGHLLLMWRSYRGLRAVAIDDDRTRRAL
jgi:hypothetical protein